MAEPVDRPNDEERDLAGVRAESRGRAPRHRSSISLENECSRRGQFVLSGER